ncbi:MAG: HAD family phosphatase [Calditrichaeota bacterium]|nr:MAG: HAD family phosphatase [Calditrichota bacterium]
MKTAVLFDYDGVIADTMREHARAWQNIFAKIGIAIEPMEIYLQEGRRTQEVVGYILQKYGREADAETCKKIAKMKENMFISSRNTSLYEGALKLVEQLHRAGVPLGLVTGSPRRSVLAVVPEEVIGRFRVVVTAEDVTAGKPSPEPYLAAARKLRISPECCLAVENAPLGIQSAKAAGMTVLAITTTLPDEALSQADEVVHSFEELHAALSRSMNLHEEFAQGACMNTNKG